MKKQLFIIVLIALCILGCSLSGSGKGISRNTVFFCAVEEGIGKIKAADLDGGNVRDVLTGLSGDIADVEVDCIHSKLYWVESESHIVEPEHKAFIWRANINGGNVEKIREAAGVSIQYIELDVDAGKIYWEEGSGENVGTFYRADLDGNDPQALTVGSAVYGIALHRSENRLYFTDWNGPWKGVSYFSLADPDNKINVFDSVDSLAEGGLELDTAGGKIYWTEWHGGLKGIHRVNFNGTGSEQIVFGGDCTDPFELALDLTEGKIYWTDRYRGVGSSDMDGADVEYIFQLDDPQPDCVRGIALYK